MGQPAAPVHRGAGRFLLGLGAGSEQFLGWAGITRSRPLATAQAALISLRALLGHEDVDRARLPEWLGPQSMLRFPLARPVPVYIGAMGPKMLEMAGRHAAKQRQLPESDWLERDSLVACPDPEERLIMRITRTARRSMRSSDLT